MQRARRSLLLALCWPCLALAGGAGPALARETTVTGSAGTGYDFRERTYDRQAADKENEGDVQKISIGPDITVVSKGVYDTLNLRYSPKLNYDFVDDENEVDHQLSVGNERLLTSRWSLTLSDDFLYSDDPEASSSFFSDGSASGSTGQDQGPSRDALSRDLSGRQYWTNTAGVRTSYALLETTRIGGGYSYAVLRNEEGGASGSDSYDEYDKHSFFANLTHGFNQHWRSSVGANYTRGLYDEPPPTAANQPAAAANPDLDEYGASLGVDYVRSVRDFFPAKYVVSETQYDGESRRDSQSHEWSVGWDHAFDARTHLSLGGGPSYAKIQGLEGTWGYNAYLTFMKQYEHISYSLQVDKRYETQNFSGTRDATGLTDTYNVRANMTVQATQALGFDLFGRYSRQSEMDPQGEYLDALGGMQSGPTTGDLTYDKDIYEAGLGMRYSFGRWYTAGIKYAYYVSDGQMDSDQYTDHRVLFTLSATKELWRW